MDRREALFGLTASALPILGLTSPSHVQQVSPIKLATPADLLEAERMHILRTADNRPVKDVLEAAITQIVYLSNLPRL